MRRKDAVWSRLAPFHEGRHRRCAFHYSISFQLGLVKRSRCCLGGWEAKFASSPPVTSTEIWSSTGWAADQTLERFLSRGFESSIRVTNCCPSRSRSFTRQDYIITRVWRGKVAVKTRFLERFLMLMFPIDRPWVMHRLLYLCAATTPKSGTMLLWVR